MFFFAYLFTSILEDIRIAGTAILNTLFPYNTYVNGDEGETEPNKYFPRWGYKVSRSNAWKDTQAFERREKHWDFCLMFRRKVKADEANKKV